MIASRRLLYIFLLCIIALPMVTVTPSATAQTPEKDPFKIWLSNDVPLAFRDMLTPLIETDNYSWIGSADDADLVVQFDKENQAITSTWMYVPVVTFDNLKETIQFSSIESFWKGFPDGLKYLTDTDEAPTLLVSSDTYAALEFILGTPKENTPVEVVPADAISTLLWERRPNVWAIEAFDQLSPDMKVLTMDGVYIFGDNFNLDTYPLKAKIAMSGTEKAMGNATEDFLELKTWQSSNRDPNKMTRIVLSGVTAMTRATAHKMETLGITYPANGIMDFVGDAHVFHTSNEVAFSEMCPPADPFLSTTIFCASDEYMGLLKFIGLTVVELTGNHVNDYGPGAFRHSLDLYDKEGIGTFGGGRTPEDARDAYVVEVNGNKIAFIGCNVPGPFKAWASEEREGAAKCDEAYLEEELPRLAAENDIVIMTVQQWEFYRYSVGGEQLRQFTRYSELGADIVIGSQAHQPQGFSFIPRTDGQSPSFLHHGLGNLFFDQMAQIGTRQMFIDKLIVYDGKLISVVLYTGLIEDYCCARPMTLEERTSFLDIIFQASGW